MYIKKIFEANDRVALRFSVIDSPEIGKVFKFLSYLETEVAVKKKDKILMMDCIVYDDDKSEVILARSERLDLIK